MWLNTLAWPCARFGATAAIVPDDPRIVIGVAAVITNGDHRPGRDAGRLRPDHQPGHQPADDPAGAAPGTGPRCRRLAPLPPDRRRGDRGTGRRRAAGGAAGQAPARVAVYGARNWSTVVYGSTNAYFETNNWTLAEGRLFEERSCEPAPRLRDRRDGAARALRRREPVGARCGCAISAARSSGCCRASGQAAMGQDQDDIVVMPIAAVQRRLTGNLNVGTLLVSMDDGARCRTREADLTRLLRERRKLAESDRTISTSRHQATGRDAVEHDTGDDDAARRRRRGQPAGRASAS